MPWGFVFLAELDEVALTQSYHFRNDPKRDVKVRSELDATIKKMEQLGAIIFDPADIPSSEEWITKSMSDDITVIANEFKEDMKKYLDTMKSTEITCLRDIIE